MANTPQAYDRYEQESHIDRESVMMVQATSGSLWILPRTLRKWVEGWALGLRWNAAPFVQFLEWLVSPIMNRRQFQAMVSTLVCDAEMRGRCQVARALP